MRCALVLVLAIAAPAAAKPERPTLVPLPALALVRRERPQASGPVLVIGPTTPTRKQPALDDRERAVLDRRSTTATGIEKIAALDALTAALEQLEPPDEELELLMGEIAMRYARVLFEPALETYPHADELIVRAAKSIAMADDKTPIKALERMLVKFPRSPFVYDARMQLAQLAEIRHDFKTAKRHLQAIVATHTGVFARFARLRLAWVFNEMKDYPAALAQLRPLLLDDADPQISGAAADVIILPYSHVGRAELAAALFDRADRSQSAERLRILATGYGVQGKPAEEAIVLRAAIAREFDHTVSCHDRADLVTALISTPNRVDAELAIAELAEAVQSGDQSCASAADTAVGLLASTWHAKPGKADRAQLVRVWTRAAELATIPARREAATLNRSALTRAERPAR